MILSYHLLEGKPTLRSTRELHTRSSRLISRQKEETFLKESLVSVKPNARSLGGFKPESERNKGFPGGPSGEEPATSAGDLIDLGLIPGLGRPSGEGNGYPLWYSCLENPMDRGAWQATVHRVTQNQTRLKPLSTHTQKDRPGSWHPACS